MTDKPDPQETTTIKLDLTAWIIGMFSALGLGTPSQPSQQVTVKPSAASSSGGDGEPPRDPVDPPTSSDQPDLPLEALRSRLGKIAPPDGAPEPEARAIVEEAARIGGMIDALTRIEDVGRVEEALAALEEIVRETAGRIAARKTRAKDLALRLKSLRDEVGVSSELSMEFAKDAPQIAAALSAPWTDGGLEQAGLRIAHYQERAMRALEAFKAEATRLGDELSKIGPPKGAIAAEAEPILAKKGELQSALGGRLTPEALRELDGEIKALSALCDKAAEAARERAAKAEDIRSGLGAVEDPPGLAKAAEDRLAALRKEAADALGEPGEDRVYQPEALLAAETALKRLISAAKEIGEQIVLWKAEADRLLKTTEIGDPENANPDETSKLKLLREDVGKALAARPLDETVIEAGTAASGLFETSRAEIIEDIKARATEAEDLTRRAGVASGPLAGAPKGEQDELTELAKEVTAPLALPTTDQNMADARMALDALTKRREEIRLAVEARVRRAGELTTFVQQAKDPDHVNTAESTELADLLSKITDGLAAPFTAEMIAAAEKAHGAYTLKHSEIATAAGDRKLKRDAYLKDLDTGTVDAGATPLEKARIIRMRDGLRGLIAKAETEPELDKLKPSIDEVAKLVADSAALVNERKAAQLKINSLISALKASEAKMGMTTLGICRKAVLTAKSQLAAAANATEMKAAGTTASDAEARIAPSLAFAKAYVEWYQATQIMVKFMPSTGVKDQQDVLTKFLDIAKRARALADQARYTDAQTELNKFAAEAGLSGPEVASATAYAKEIDAFMANDYARLKAVKQSGLSAASGLLGTFNGIYQTLKTSSPKNYMAARGALISLRTLYQDLEPVAELYVKYKPQNAVTEVGTARSQADAEASAGNYLAAVNKFSGLSTTVKEKAEFNAKRVELNKAYNAAKGDFSTAERTHCSGLLTGAATDSGSGNHSDAMSKLAALEAALPEIIAWNAGVKPLETRRAAIDASDTHGFLTAATAKAATHDYDEASNLLTPAREAIGAFERYEHHRGIAEAIKAAMTPDTEPTSPFGRLSKALTDAAGQITAKDFAAAKKTLEDVLASTDFEAEAAARSHYLAVHARVKAKHDKIHATLKLAKVKDALKQEFDAAAALAKPDGGHADAVDALLAYEPKTAEAKAYYAARIQAHAVKKAIDDVDTKASSGDARYTGFTAYGSPTKQAVIDRMTGADKFATAGNFKQALKEYRSLVTDCKTIITNVAKKLEQVDGTGSNAGHSLDRHGPDVTREQQLQRLELGRAADWVAPDPSDTSLTGLSKASYCPAASQFTDIADWLAGREMAKDQLRAMTPNPIDPDASEIDFADPNKVPLEVDHGKGIGIALDGDRKHQEIKGNGQVGNSRGYASYTEVDGMTKSFVNWIFEFDRPDGHAIDGSHPKPRNKDQYRTQWQAMDPTNNTGDPAKIKGHWVMMQYYPKVKGWDQETQSYP